MKANILYGINDLRVEECEKPQIKPDEVLVKVKASGICGSDIARVFTTGTYSFPLIIGCTALNTRGVDLSHMTWT